MTTNYRNIMQTLTRSGLPTPVVVAGYATYGETRESLSFNITQVEGNHTLTPDELVAATAALADVIFGSGK